MEILVEHVHLFLFELFDVAIERDNFKFDEYGDVYLDNIPLKLLYCSLVASMNGTLLKQLVDRENKKLNFDVEQLRNILLQDFAVQEISDGVMKIYMPTEENFRQKIARFHVVSFYKMIYERDQLIGKDGDNSEQIVENFNMKHIVIPFYVNMQRAGSEEKKVTLKNDYLKNWKNEMKTFLLEELDEDYSQWYLEDIELDRIERNLPYLMGFD